MASFLPQLRTAAWLAAALLAFSPPVGANAFRDHMRCAMTDMKTGELYELEYTIDVWQTGNGLDQRIVVTMGNDKPIAFQRAQVWEGGGAVLTADLDAGPMILTVSGNMNAMLIRSDMDVPQAKFDTGTCGDIE